MSSSMRSLEAGQEFLDQFDVLPTISASAQSVLAALQDPQGSLSEVSVLVQRDPALTARLLKVANSAFYPSLERVSSLQLALSRLGAAEVRQLVLTTAVLETFGGLKDSMDWSAFWEHSFAAGIASHLVSDPKRSGREMSKLGENPTFVAGLLHHLGILIEHLREPALFEKARLRSIQQGSSLAEAELEVFGFTHAEIGAALLARWKLPQDVVHATLDHHDPEAYEGPYRRTVQAVHLSAMLCHDLGHGARLEGATPWFSEKAFFELGWSLEQIPVLKQRVGEAILQAKELGQAMLGGQR